MLQKNGWAALLMVVIFLTGCAGQPDSRSPTVHASAPPMTGGTVMTRTAAATASLTPSLTPSATRTPRETPIPGPGELASPCKPAPIVAPTMAPYPGSNALDETTGLHVTGHAVTIDVASYRLVVTGLVDHPLSLSYDDLRCMPKVTAKLILDCPLVFEDTATWSGVPLKYILELAGVKSEAKVIRMVAADKYEIQIFIQDGRRDGNFLAYEWNGQPLPVLHGFPLRAVFPSMPGNKWIKWLLEIIVE